MNNIRTPEQCRKRWDAFKRTNKTKWSSSEDLSLKEAVHSSIKNNKVIWSEVAEKMKTRSTAQCWHRWNRCLLISDPLFWGGPNYLKGNIVLSIKS